MIEGGGRPDSGEILFQGARIDRIPRWSRAHRGIGRTFQSTRLFPELTVRENLVAPLRAFRWRTLTARAMNGAEARKAERMLSIVGLERYLDEPAGELSFGQQKLVELAQILMLDPDLVLLDEPAGGINEALIEQMRDIILALRDAGTTFLVVEHNMPFVLSLCDTVHVLSAGRRIASGTPDEVRNDPGVLEAYLGAASAGTEVTR
jgi:branched-chain amino acid transport system permease protein